VNEYFLDIIQRHRQAGVLVDTNLLLLYYVGSFRPELISQFKRTDIFTEDDFILLVELLAQFPKVLTTPYVLTEVSNLAGQLGSHLKPEFFALFAACLGLLEELQQSSKDLSQTPEFIKFGLTDTALIALARENILVLTAEFPLANFLQSQNLAVINFNHLRSW
jgi:hypothetical protein